MSEIENGDVFIDIDPNQDSYRTIIFIKQGYNYAKLYFDNDGEPRICPSTGKDFDFAGFKKVGTIKDLNKALYRDLDNA